MKELILTVTLIDLRFEMNLVADSSEIIYNA